MVDLVWPRRSLRRLRPKRNSMIPKWSVIHELNFVIRRNCISICFGTVFVGQSDNRRSYFTLFFVSILGFAPILELLVGLLRKLYGDTDGLICDCSDRTRNIPKTSTMVFFPDAVPWRAVDCGGGKATAQSTISSSATGLSSSSSSSSSGSMFWLITKISSTVGKKRVDCSA